MSAIRQSFLVSMETEFGRGKCPSASWIAPPPGSYFNSTHNRATSRIQSTGSKYWDTVAYGQMTGSWDWTFTLDYEYLTPLLFVFERCVIKRFGAPSQAYPQGVPLSDDTPLLVEDQETGDLVPNPDIKRCEYRFSKTNAGRVPSFTVRRKILNYMAGGPVASDEVEELRGCVCKNFRFTKNDQNSQINVTMTGFYVDEKMWTGSLDVTDYEEYEGNLVDWMCMYVNDGEADNYVANTDSLGISVENNAGAVYNVCSPFAKNFYEGLSNYTFTTTCYSTNPDNYKKRLYYGGMKGWTNSTEGPTILRPQAKGLAPIPWIKLVSYSGTSRNDVTTDHPEMDLEEMLKPYDPETGYGSDRWLIFDIFDCVIKSLTWPKGNGGMIQDSISSTECKKIDLTISVSTPMVINPCDAGVAHAKESVDPTYNANRPKHCICNDTSVVDDINEP